MKEKITITIEDFLKACSESKLEIQKNAMKSNSYNDVTGMVFNLIFEIHNAQLVKILFKDDDKLEIEGHE